MYLTLFKNYSEIEKLKASLRLGLDYDGEDDEVGDGEEGSVVGEESNEESDDDGLDLAKKIERLRAQEKGNIS